MVASYPGLRFRASAGESCVGSGLRTYWNVVLARRVPYTAGEQGRSSRGPVPRFPFPVLFTCMRKAGVVGDW